MIRLSTIDINNFFSDLTCSDLVTCVNPFSYEMLNNDKYITSIDYFLSDGVLLTWLHNWFLDTNKIKRQSFDNTSIGKDVLCKCNEMSLSVIFIGGKAKEIKKFKQYISKSYSNIDGHFFDGFFKKDEAKSIIKEIQQIKPSVIVVGMGSPKQEDFSITIKENLAGPAKIFTCGGFITQTSISENYYPDYIDKLNLRWLYRIVFAKHVRKKFFLPYLRFLIYFFRKKNEFL